MDDGDDERKMERGMFNRPATKIDHDTLKLNFIMPRLYVYGTVFLCRDTELRSMFYIECSRMGGLMMVLTANFYFC